MVGMGDKRVVTNRQSGAPSQQSQDKEIGFHRYVLVGSRGKSLMRPNPQKLQEIVWRSIQSSHKGGSVVVRSCASAEDPIGEDQRCASKVSNPKYVNEALK